MDSGVRSKTNRTLCASLFLALRSRGSFFSRNARLGGTGAGGGGNRGGGEQGIRGIRGIRNTEGFFREPAAPVQSQSQSQSQSRSQYPHVCLPPISTCDCEKIRHAEKKSAIPRMFQ
jgi:hypothetical protein